MKNIKIKGLDENDLGKLSIQYLTRVENGKATIGNNVSFEGRKKAGLKNKETGHIQSIGKEYGPLVGKVWGKINGKKNVESGLMERIQKIGAPIVVKVSGNNKTKKQLKKLSQLGNEANQQKHGKRIIAYNENTEECWEYISIRECERDLKIQAPNIRKILKGTQPKTRCGWIFNYSLK
jgi:ABC-type cobalt transport system substrate-binding protein